MKDSEFKKLEHRHLDGKFKVYSNGGELENGYKPDFTLKHTIKEEYIILESEHASSRKHIIGGVVKAAKFLTGSRQGNFVVMLQEKNNTKKEQIANQLQTYFHWIKPLTNLKYGYVIYDHDYISDNGKPILIESDKFLKHAIIVK